MSKKITFISIGLIVLFVVVVIIFGIGFLVIAVVSLFFFKLFKNDVSVLVENKIASAHSEVIFVFVFLTAVVAVVG